MKFSIVTTSFNGGAYIGEAIESAWRQRGDVAAFEHIVADAVSTDDTADVLSRYPHLDIAVKKDRGIYDGMNSAIARASGDVVVILNTDDLLPDGALAAAREAFQKTNAEVVSGGFQLRRGRLAEETAVVAPIRAPSYEGLLFGIPAINARYFRRDVFERLGGFDLAYRLAADRALLIDALAKRLTTATIPHALYIYRQHAGSATLSEDKEAARRMYSEHLSLSEALAPRADTALAQALSAFEAVERIKLDALDLRGGPPMRRVSAAARLMRTAVARPADVAHGLALWRRYRRAHADS